MTRPYPGPALKGIYTELMNRYLRALLVNVFLVIVISLITDGSLDGLVYFFRLPFMHVILGLLNIFIATYLALARKRDARIYFIIAGVLLLAGLLRWKHGV